MNTAMTATHCHRHWMNNTIQCNECRTPTQTFNEKHTMQWTPYTDADNANNATHWHRHWMNNIIQCNECHTLSQSLKELNHTIQWMPHTDTNTKWITSYNAMNATHCHRHWMNDIIQCNDCHTLIQTLNEKHTMQWAPYINTYTDNAMNATHWHSSLVFYALSTITVT